MAMKLAAMPIAKLKLLEKALGNLAVVAKNSGPLNELFSTMKEGSMITAPWTTLLDMLKAETTKASVETIKSLFALLKDESTQSGIAALSAAFSGLIAGIGSTTTSLLQLLGPLGQTEGGLNLLTLAFKALLTPMWNVQGNVENMKELLKLLGVTMEDITIWSEKLRNALKFPDDWWEAIIEFFTGRRIPTERKDYAGMYDIGGTIESYEDLVRRLKEEFKDW